jgi:hypothetical protein
MPTNFETEMLILPKEYSVGRITVYRPNETEPSEFLEAQGTVRVPKSSKLFLDLSQAACDDLHKLRFIPNSLLVNGISISERSLTRADFRELSSLNLHSLAITYCDGILPEQLRQLGGLDSLEHLNLDRTPLGHPDFSWVLPLSNIRSLLLSGTGADGTCIPLLAKLHRLEELHLTNCKITDHDAQAIWRFSGIKAVNLGMCPITDRALEGIGGSSALNSLSVPDTRISDEGVEILVGEALRTDQRLRLLVLRSCRVTDKALVRLASLRNLIFIDLYGTEVTPEGASFLKKSLPECRIFVGRDKGGGPRLWNVDHT